jgi:integrase
MSELAINLRLVTIARAADHWLGELERRGHSDRTLATYRRLLDKFADAHPHDDVSEITAMQVRRFLDSEGRKRDGARKAAATIAQNVSIVNGFFDWLTREEAIKRNPTRRNGDRVIARPKQLRPEENDAVTTVSADEVRCLLDAAERGTWGERLAVNCLAYLGPRRRALAIARRDDYDQGERMMTFREKGAKTIEKPVPDRLADLLDAAIAAGVYETGDDYLIPGRAMQRRPGDRDDRIIWHLVRAVAERAGIKTHVHALRAAFATHYLDMHPGQIEALQDLLGHARIETTLVYLRRRDRRRSMETVRDLDWGSKPTSIAPHDNYRPTQIAAKTLESSPFTEKEGFEPSMEVYTPITP